MVVGILGRSESLLMNIEESPVDLSQLVEQKSRRITSIGIFKIIHGKRKAVTRPHLKESPFQGLWTWHVSVCLEMDLQTRRIYVCEYFHDE